MTVGAARNQLEIPGSQHTAAFKRRGAQSVGGDMISGLVLGYGDGSLVLVRQALSLELLKARGHLGSYLLALSKPDARHLAPSTRLRAPKTRTLNP